jgi:hypothetical protein
MPNTINLAKIQIKYNVTVNVMIVKVVSLHLSDASGVKHVLKLIITDFINLKIKNILIGLFIWLKHYFLEQL